MSKKILILGAGYAGVEAALSLQKNKKKDDIEIYLIDKNPYHTLLTELHEVAGNRVSEDAVLVPLKDIFRYTSVKIINDNILSMDFNSKKLLSDTKQYSYDYLIIAGGSEPNFYGIPGMEDHSFPLWSYENAIKIREHIRSCFRKASEESDKDKIKALLTFVVGGGGFTGVEMIGELAHWIKSLCREFNIDRSGVRLVLVEALPTILPILKEKNIKKAAAYLTKKLNVEVMTECSISKLNIDSVEFKDKNKLPTNTLIWTAGIRASCIADEMDISKGKACRIKVNEYTQTEYPGVYSIGDISAFEVKGSLLPALVEGALQTGDAAAKNILRDIRGIEKKKLEPKLHGVMVSIGSFFAVAELMGYSLPSFLAVTMKYLVNMHYLFGIGGFELVFKYLKHEILNKKQERFLLEKHYSVMTPSFWLVPIRLFLGYSWLAEGIGKIRSGWLEAVMLSASPVDATTSASITSIVSPHTPGWYGWIAVNVVVPNAIVFQTLIVLTEIALGLAFLSGTFTFIAALASIGLALNFILSTGLPSTSWWYIPAALCMLGGAGRAFGIDYYLMPYLMRQWRYFVRNKKLKLFLFK